MPKSKRRGIKQRRGVKTKPRSTALVFDMGEPVTLTDVRFDPITRQPQFFSNGTILIPRTVQLQTSYKRENKEKITSSVEIDPVSITMHHLEALFKFDYLVAIDTNTREINGRRISVTGVMKTSISRRENALVLGYVGYDAIAFCTKSNEMNSEKLGWSMFVRSLMSWSGFKAEWRVGLVVDAHLSEHLLINERSMPLHDDFYLPRNFSLLYASSDVATDTLQGKMIRQADMLATFILNSFSSGLLNSRLGELDTGFRVWRNLPMKKRLDGKWNVEVQMTFADRNAQLSSA